MAYVQVFEPAMCCSTGVCGPSVDPVLVRFAADVEWLMNQGVMVERYNLSQRPQAFVENGVVKDALQKGGVNILPLVMIDGEVAFEGAYPSRAEITARVGLKTEDAPASLMTAAVAELVAIGAAIASNCEPCFRAHYDQARKLGVSKEDMWLAVKVAQAVKEQPAKTVLTLATRYLNPAGQADASDELRIIDTSKCCG